MNLILPKKFEMKNRGYPFVYNDNWISNGEFMVKKLAVKDSFKYCVPNESAQVECDRIVPQESDSEWVKTEFIYDNGKLGYLRVFKCYELNKTICFKDEYVRHFDIQSMKGHSEDLMAPFVSDNGLVVLMPYHNSPSLDQLRGNFEKGMR